MEAALSQLLAAHAAPSSPFGGHANNNLLNNNNNNNNNKNSLDWLSSLTMLAKANSTLETGSGMASSPKSDGGDEVAFSFSSNFNTKKRSLGDLLDASSSGLEDQNTSKRSKQESPSFSSLCHTDSYSSLFSSNNNMNNSCAREHQQSEQQRSTFATTDTNTLAATLSTANLINLLLVQNALKKTLSATQSSQSLFDNATVPCASRRSSAVSTSSVFSYDPNSDMEVHPFTVADTKPSEPRRKSAYRGVIWDKNSRAWRAKLSVKGKLMHVGLFEDEKEAAIAWDKKAIEVRGHKTRLNFPELVSDLYRIELTSRRIRKRG